MISYDLVVVHIADIRMDKGDLWFADENERATLRAKFEPPLSPPRHVKPILFKAFRSTNPIKDVQHLSSWNSSSVGNHRSSSE
jgi:hypothetical protein